MKGVVQCELPNKDLYKFDGYMYKEAQPDKKMSLGVKQCVLRVRNHTFQIDKLTRVVN